MGQLTSTFVAVSLPKAAVDSHGQRKKKYIWANAL